MLAKREEKKHPCRACGKLRTKAEGGATFTVCDECWESYPHKPHAVALETARRALPTQTAILQYALAEAFSTAYDPLVQAAQNSLRADVCSPGECNTCDALRTALREVVGND